MRPTRTFCASLLASLASTLFAAGLALQAQATELDDFKTKHDICAPESSVGLPFNDDLHEADFIWFANGEECSGVLLSWITNIVHNHSNTDLIFKWPKGGIWADKFNPLPKEHSRGQSAPVISVNPKPDTNAPILYTQSYMPSAPAAVYVADTDDVSENELGTNTNKLVTKIRTASRTERGIVKVVVDFISVSKPEEKHIYTEVYVFPNNATVAVARIPDYLDKLDPNTRKQAIEALDVSLKEQNTFFKITSLRELIGNERSKYVPKDLVDSRYLVIAGRKYPIQFPLPISRGAKNEFDPERFTAELASIVVLDTKGAVIGNGRVSLWLPALRQ